MQKIDLKQIIETSGLKKSYLAKNLFPDNKHPDRAINSVLNGSMNLDSVQISKLSELLSVPIGLLFTCAEWGMSAPSGLNRRIVQFRTYDFFAELNLDTMTTTVSQNGLFLFETIAYPHGVEINAYLSSLTDLIIKYKQK